MSTPLADQPAFPHIAEVKERCSDGSYIMRQLTSGGLTTRQHFAAMAMQGVLANETFTTRWYRDVKAPSHYGMRVAEEAVYMADALIAELEKRK